MLQRTVSAAIVLLVTVVPLVLGTYGWLALVLSILILGSRELAHGLGRLTGAPLSVASIVLAGSAPILVVASPLPAVLLLAALTLSTFLPLAWHVRGADFRTGLQRGTLAVFASFYLGVPLAASLALRALEGQSPAEWVVALAGVTGQPQTAFGLAWLLWTLSVTWFTDIAAYVVGSRWGKHKLAPRISPGKTREGAIAGCLAGVGVGLGSTLLLALPIGWPLGAALGGVLAILAELGDLAESYVKRALGLKDFGTLLPGHGGVIDRIDALLLTMPASLVLATLLTGG